MVRVNIMFHKNLTYENDNKKLYLVAEANIESLLVITIKKLNVSQ